MVTVGTRLDRYINLRVPAVTLSENVVNLRLNLLFEYFTYTFPFPPIPSSRGLDSLT